MVALLKSTQNNNAINFCSLLGVDYLPFAEIPSLRNMVLTGEDDEDMSYMAINNGPYAALPSSEPADNNSPVPFGNKKSGFRPVYD